MSLMDRQEQLPFRSRHNEQSGMFQCPSCYNFYKTKKTMLTHLRNQCRKPPMFECVHCGIRKYQKIHIMKHMETHHPNMPFLVQDNRPIK